MSVNKIMVVVGVMVLLMVSCKTPAKIDYFQDLSDSMVVRVVNAQPIKLQPLDKVSIVVNGRDPQITAMFNLPYYTKTMGESQSLSGLGGNISTSQTAQSISAYTVDSKGEIDFPTLGKVRIAGLTREEAAEYIKDKLVESAQIKDPVVTIEYMNLGVSVLGEVKNPGRYKIDRDVFTVLDAIGIAGDMTINGKRDSVMLIRHEGDQDKIYKLDITNAAQVYASRGFYIQQGDVVYVAPNKKRKREATVNGNNVRSASFWISLASLLTSVAVLVVK